MQDFLLLLSVLAIFVFGWFLMKKLDDFLDENRKPQIFLPEEVDILEEKDYKREETTLAFTPMIMKGGELPIEPIADGNVSRNVATLAVGGNRWNCQDRIRMSYCTGGIMNCQIHQREN